MNTIRITLNNKPVTALVEGRTSLADFVREQRTLTGTHLACEHGVCGACTILLDDSPVRGCITFAAGLDGRDVKTIEAFDDDPLMELIRRCFSEAHGLQCGFCTPGMLITVRDIIRRSAGGTSQAIRQELSGNLCRCTGYSGIVRAVELAVARAAHQE